MNLRGIVRIYAVAAAVLLAALLGTSVAAVSRLERATGVEARRFQSLRLADELRQTSDDLTRMGRTYVVTGERRYRDYFEEILAIRDGRAPRPEAYDRIYWDVVTSTGQRPRPFGPAVAYEVLAAAAPSGSSCPSSGHRGRCGPRPGTAISWMVDESWWWTTTRPIAWC